MTTQREAGWQEAIIAVLQDAGGPMRYDAITQIIGERGLRTLTGATPATTVNAYLSNMVNPDHAWYDSRVLKVGRGVFQFDAPDPLSAEVDQEDAGLDYEEPGEHPNQIVGVPAFGLYWEKEKVGWNSGEILGRQTHDSTPVNFADQQGIYLLHKDRSVAYVGRTTNSLYQRLRSHSRDHKSVRWDRFSWFGFRDVDGQSGQLLPMAGEVTPEQLINILEAVLIEALEPPVNGRRGDYLGLQYEQIPDRAIAQWQTRAFLQNLIG